VGRLCLVRGCAVALIGVASYCGAPAQAAGPAEFVPAYSDSQIMLYMSWSFGAHGTRPETFGLRYERSSPSSTEPGTRFSAPLAHHSLIDLQFARGAAPRMQFGPRVTWDISRGRLGPTNLFNGWQLPAPYFAASTSAAWPR
jgi:hypothetical protein